MCRSSRAITLFPNEHISLSTGNQFVDEFAALEPRDVSQTVSRTSWPPVQIVPVINNEIRIVNNTSDPIHIPKNEQLCHVRSTHIIHNDKSSGPSVPLQVTSSRSE